MGEPSFLENVDVGGVEVKKLVKVLVGVDTLGVNAEGLPPVKRGRIGTVSCGIGGETGSCSRYVRVESWRRGRRAELEWRWERERLPPSTDVSLLLGLEERSKDGLQWCGRLKLEEAQKARPLRWHVFKTGCIRESAPDVLARAHCRSAEEGVTSDCAGGQVHQDSSSSPMWSGWVL